MHHLQMLLQIRSPGEAVAANIALKRFEANVIVPVRSQVRFRVETFATFVALECGDAIVAQNVRFYGETIFGGVAALVAVVGDHLRVCVPPFYMIQ